MRQNRKIWKMLIWKKIKSIREKIMSCRYTCFVYWHRSWSYPKHSFQLEIQQKWQYQTYCKLWTSITHKRLTFDICWNAWLGSHIGKSLRKSNYVEEHANPYRESHYREFTHIWYKIGESEKCSSERKPNQFERLFSWNAVTHALCIGLGLDHIQRTASNFKYNKSYNTKHIGNFEPL